MVRARNGRRRRHDGRHSKHALRWYAWWGRGELVDIVKVYV